jgi:hypothetical protein
MQKEWKFGRRCPGIAAATILMAGLLPVPAADSTEPCCFTNTRYEGVCTVIPAKEESCQSILTYLNNPMATGKSYCGGTSIRRGWVRVDCKTGKPIMEKGTPAATPKPQESLSKESR